MDILDTSSGTPLGGETTEIAGRDVTSLTRELTPGQTVSVEYSVQPTAPGADDESGMVTGTRTIDLWTTPTVRKPGLETVDVVRCG